MSRSRKNILSSSTKISKNSSQSENSSDVINQLDNLRGKTKKEHKNVAHTTSSKNQIINVGVIIIIATAGLLIFYTPPISLTPPPVPPPGTEPLLDGFTRDKGATPLFTGGKLNILYIGGQYCPYCAMERWSIVMALEQFGTFLNLNQLPGGSAEDHVPTYDFIGASYTSNILEFTPFETMNNVAPPNEGPLQTLSSQASTIYNSYDSSGYIPFICLGGCIYRTGAGSSLNINSFTNVAFTTIQNQMGQKSGALYGQIHTEANYLVQLIHQLLATHNSTSLTSTSTTG